MSGGRKVQPGAKDR